jgi:hypothetical protein
MKVFFGSTMNYMPAYYILVAKGVQLYSMYLLQVKETRSVSGHTVGDFVKTGGTDYSLFGDNCIDAASRMTGLGNK